MEQTAWGGRSTYYWLLAESEREWTEVLTEKTPEGEEVVPVFGSGEDARAYLPGKGGWEPRKTGGGELVSVLFGVCRGARYVALDPPPGMDPEEAVRLVGIGRERFAEALLGRGRPWFEGSHRERRPLALVR